MGPDWSIETAEHGKPYLVGQDLQFNLSHSHQLALLAFCHREVGVDVEYTGRPVEYLALARRFFSQQEVELFEQLDPAAQQDEFFTIWTRKEAYIKALGEGLSHPLDDFSVNLDRSRPAFLDCPGWSLHELAVPRDYRAALAVRGNGLRIQTFDFE